MSTRWARVAAGAFFAAVAVIGPAQAEDADADTDALVARAVAALEKVGCANVPISSYEEALDNVDWGEDMTAAREAVNALAARGDIIVDEDAKVATLTIGPTCGPAWTTEAEAIRAFTIDLIAKLGCRDVARDDLTNAFDAADPDRFNQMHAGKVVGEMLQSGEIVIDRQNNTVTLNVGEACGG